MRKHLTRTSAILALALVSLIGAIAACGGWPSTATTSPASTCVNASAPHRAYVVVLHQSGTTVQKCVGFTTETIDGQALMDQSGIEFQAQAFSFGNAMCQIDNEPSKFDKCFNASGSNWALFFASKGSWTVPQTSYTQVTLHDKEVMGWRYMAYDPSPSPPPLPKAS